MFAAKLGHRYSAFSLAQDRKDLGFAISRHLPSKSPHAPCREIATSTAPYFRGRLPPQNLSGSARLEVYIWSYFAWSAWDLAVKSSLGAYVLSVSQGSVRQFSDRQIFGAQLFVVQYFLGGTVIDD
jgi:hypothetical protein